MSLFGNTQKLHIGIIVLLFVGVFGGMLTVTSHTKVEARACSANFNMDCWYGYFNGKFQNTGFDVIQGGIYSTNATDFTNQVGSYLNCGGPFPNNQNAVGAAFIVMTMLNIPPVSGIGPACARFGEWRSRIFEYEANGQIEWNRWQAYSMNTFYQPKWNDDAFYPENGASGAIVFKRPDGSVLYSIRRECGNPIGEVQGLPYYPPPDWNINGYSEAQNLTAGPNVYRMGNNTYAYPGETVRWHHVVKNDGPGNTPNFEFGTRTSYNASGQVVSTPDPNWVQSLGVGQYIDSWSLIDRVVPNSADTLICGWMAYTNRNRSGAHGASTQACANILKPIANCSASTATLTPSEVQPGAPFSVNSAIAYQDDRAATSARNNGSNYYVRVVRVVGGVETQVFNQELIPTTVSAGKLVGQQVTVPGSQINVAGTYKVYWGNKGTLGNATCGDPFEAAYYPYFNVVGGDISAGGSFMDGTSCSPKPNSGIKGWNNGGAYFGAGTQLAALALGQIVDFATATNAGDGSSTAPTTTLNNGLSTNLTFANASGISGRLGSAAMPCMPDYYSGASANAQDVAGNTLLLSSLLPTAGGTYKYDNNLTIYTTNILFPSVVSDGRQITVIVDGDVYIQNDIKYAAYNNPRNIPRFTLIAKGNIYIDASVDELHGVFIAQSGGVSTKGIVNTCSSGFAALVGTYIACNNQLKIYGAVAAEQIKLQRTYGSLIASAGAPAAPAETFIYSPELWLANSGIDASGGAQPYDAITTLPPAL